MANRTSVRMMARSISHAWNGNSITDSSAWAAAVRASSARARRNTPTEEPCRGAASNRVSVSSVAPPITPRAIAVHAAGRPGHTVQPATRKASSAGGTRLRRRLSRIFQRLISGSRLRAMPCASGTNGNNQSRICQSPRTQRRCRRTCASTVGG